MSEGEKAFQSFLCSQEYLNYKQIINECSFDSLTLYLNVEEILRYLLNIIDDCEKIHTFDEKTERRYFRSLMTGLLFDTLVEYDVCNLVEKNKEKIKGANNLIKMISNKLIQFGQDISAPFHKDWKGVNYYYLKLYGVPLILKNIIDKDTYQERKKYNSDLAMELYHHPLSLNGHLRTSWEEMVSEGIIYEADI